MEREQSPLKVGPGAGRHKFAVWSQQQKMGNSGDWLERAVQILACVFISYPFGESQAVRTFLLCAKLHCLLACKTRMGLI